VGDYRGVVETATGVKVAAPTLGIGLWTSFSGLSWAEWAAIATLIYTVLLTVKLIWNWFRHGK
jgi:hypothetical protein